MLRSLLLLLLLASRAAAQTARCAADEATCADGSCIGADLRCDGYTDCPDGSDETGCGQVQCQPNEFLCANQRCVVKNWLCDGDNDCGDNSDEQNCRPREPGSPCLSTEFQCSSRRQCVPRTFQCDDRPDCQDGSDEVGCAAPTIVEQPPSVQVISLGSVFIIRCRAVGTPTPAISWRRNWAHVPDKCQQVSEGGRGVLTCPDATESDQGAYSCEAINTKGVVFAIPDTNVVVANGGLCQPPQFNSAALTNHDCLHCFCFGVISSCYSSGLFISELPAPDAREMTLVSVDLREGVFTPVIPVPGRPYAGAAGQIMMEAPLISDGQLYFQLPESHLGNQLNSYGGYIRFTAGSPAPANSPVLVMRGNGVTVYHSSDVEPRGNYYDVQIAPGNFLKADDRGETPASREEIMMVLQDLDMLFVRAIHGPDGMVSISGFRMDTAGVVTSARGPASLVESCRCPDGYTGMSCEDCTEGYQRVQAGPWLGRCEPIPEECAEGEFGDPARGIACRPCPCPGTPHQYGHTCYLDRDVQVTCNCPSGYDGRRCERCAPGYRGNPLSGEPCVPAPTCNQAGSVSEEPDQRTGQCRCKEFATGRLCDQCKRRAFHLSVLNPHGCVPCFCMGVTDQCTSCSWNREQVSAVFTNSAQGVTLTDDMAEGDLGGVSVDPAERRLVAADVSQSGYRPVYWSLPAQFLGDKVTAYGGSLRFTQSYSTDQPGAFDYFPDVEIMGNDVRLMHMVEGRVPANRASAVEVPILETAWRRDDGGPVNREHLMLALADLDYIIIKAADAAAASQATLSDVSMDIATAQSTGQERAFAVEQCSCPVGYRGLSCEDCAVGYTRSLSGLYLRLCVPCDCSDRSDECHPETGECLNCRGNTAGASCEECAAGYTGDPGRGVPCRPDTSGPPRCDCDPRGSLSADCDQRGQCGCMPRVEGSRCDRCAAGYFGLGSSSSEGCSSCFCSGVSRQCSEAPLHRTQIPMQVVDSQHGFALVNDAGEEAVDPSELVPSFPDNMLTYTRAVGARGTNSAIYWSLPDLFIGDKLSSYGGTLQWRQRIIYGQQDAHDAGFDVIIRGGDGSLGSTAEREIGHLHVTLSADGGWRDVETGAPADRRLLMSVLGSVDYILIRAARANLRTDLYTSLNDVVLETAIEADTRQGRAYGIEQCRCPAGYSGLSCQVQQREECVSGQYRDAAGSCQQCPCSSRQTYCQLDAAGHVRCVCQQGFTGRNCEHAGEESVAPPRAVITPRYLQLSVGQPARLECSAEGSPAPELLWIGGREGRFEPDVNIIGGTLVIGAVRKAHEAEYLCTATNSAGTDRVRTIIYVRGEDRVPPPSRVQPSFSQPARSGSATAGSAAAPPEDGSTSSVAGSPGAGPASSTAGGNPPTSSSGPEQARPSQPEQAGPSQPEQTGGQTGGQAGRRPDVRSDDRRRYSPLQVRPQRPTTYPGQSVELQCISSDPTYGEREWSRARGEPLSDAASMLGDTLVISSVSDSDRGGYICSSRDPYGRTAQASAYLDLIDLQVPRVQLYPADRQEVHVGSSALFQCRVLAGRPEPSVSWRRVSADYVNLRPTDMALLPSTAEALPGGVLRFIRVGGDESGQYTCTASSSAGEVSRTATLSVVSAPVVTLKQPMQYRVREGERVTLNCHAAGLPTPMLDWEGLRFISGRDVGMGGVPGRLELTISAAVTADSGIYTCRAENSAGRTSARLRLQVEPARAGGGRPPVSYPPSPLPPPAGADNSPAAYPAQDEDQRAGDPRLAPERPEPADTAPQRDDEQPKAGQQGDGAAAPSDGDEAVVEEEAGNITPTGEEYFVPLNGRAELTCEVAGAASSVTISWIRSDGAPMPSDHTTRGGTLYINQVQTDAEGTYTCLGLSPSDVVLFQASARLWVLEPPEVALEPARQVVRPGDQVAIECSASAGDEPITITWSRLGGDMSPDVSAIDGRLVFSSIAVSDAGRYVCAAENSAGRARGFSDVIVNDGASAPRQEGVYIRAVQPQLEAYLGSEVSLRCETSGYDGRVSWARADGRDYSESAVIEEDSITFSELAESDSGDYTCSVGRSYSGESAQDVIRLIIRPVPTPTPTRVPCPLGELPCTSGECLSPDAFCDGVTDCADGSDETQCRHPTGADTAASSSAAHGSEMSAAAEVAPAEQDRADAGEAAEEPTSEEQLQHGTTAEHEQATEAAQHGGAPENGGTPEYGGAAEYEAEAEYDSLENGELPDDEYEYEYGYEYE